MIVYHTHLCEMIWSKSKDKTQVSSWAQWLTLVIPALWEAKADRSRGQEFKTSLTNMVKACLY